MEEKSGSIQHREPAPTTKRDVALASRNACAFPDCSDEIYDVATSTYVGTICHIKARCEGGPRFDYEQTEEANRSAANLVAMCAKHSKVIDGPRWREFTVELLSSWKLEAEAGVLQAPSEIQLLRPAIGLNRLLSEATALNMGEPFGRGELRQRLVKALPKPGEWAYPGAYPREPKVREKSLTLSRESKSDERDYDLMMEFSPPATLRASEFVNYQINAQTRGSI